MFIELLFLKKWRDVRGLLASIIPFTRLFYVVHLFFYY
jgi:hypothetical protein